MLREKERYKFNLYCKCFQCDKRNYDEKNEYSCKAYPKENGIPQSVWNMANAECEYFVQKQRVNNESDTCVKQIFHFVRGAYFQGYMTYIVEERENRYFLKMRADNGFIWLSDSECEIPEEEITALAKVLEPIQKWKKEYMAKTEAVMDGYEWSIDYLFQNTRIKSEGYEQYPVGFRKVIKKIQMFLEQIGAKYDGDYLSEGLEERMRL